MNKFQVSRDDKFFQAWPDLVLTNSGKLLCVFTECIAHRDRSYTCIMLRESRDRGRTWSAKRPVTETTSDLPFYNCARLGRLKDGRIFLAVDKLFNCENDGLKPLAAEDCINLLFYSSDEGETWSRPVQVPAFGIVPDKLLELDSGRWIYSCHCCPQNFGFLTQRLWYSDDRGRSWSNPVIVAQQKGLNLCEASILPLGDNALVAFLREDSRMGRDCYKVVSRDNGENWSEPVAFPLPGCHRPVSGWLKDGRVLITYRFMHDRRMQNFFAAITDRESLFAQKRSEAQVRIMPIDYDRSPFPDLGYSGWVQFADGEIYIVSYIIDDALTRAQIRGYSLFPEEFAMEPAERCEKMEAITAG